MSGMKWVQKWDESTTTQESQRLGNKWLTLVGKPLPQSYMGLKNKPDPIQHPVCRVLETNTRRRPTSGCIWHFKWMMWNTWTIGEQQEQSSPSLKEKEDFDDERESVLWPYYSLPKSPKDHGKVIEASDNTITILFSRPMEL
eukprot:CAMPEP_0116826810 /NCGR_PEP_ID=MMETSP0418-20121206/2735_1 /TAXON_ID=1158023 /ORGANISM="Astrosyne radiata, Strain 13vi08-1A" /LENGTH=141 /DNA_ID=CAMNT_0004455485 /DNA_START=149 /DNA_END=575 /DNA_ORIENTATION=+